MRIMVLAVAVAALSLTACVIPARERAALIKQLTEQCDKQGGQLVLDHISETGTANITPYSMTVKGHCAMPGQPDYKPPTPDAPPPGA